MAKQSDEKGVRTDTGREKDSKASQSAIGPPPGAEKTKAEIKPGLYSGVVVIERAKFEELMVSLLHGYGDRYTAHALPSHVMVMFGLKSRQEAVDLLKEIQQSNTARKSNA